MNKQLQITPECASIALEAMNMKKNYVREKRLEKGLTHSQLAEKSGVPSRTIQDWEYGAKPPTNVYQIYKVAKALGCTIEELIEFSEED